MDSQRFDFLVRQWVNRASRRRMVAVLGGSVLAALGTGDVAVAKTKGKRRCPPSRPPASCDVECQEELFCNPDTDACDVVVVRGEYKCLCEVPDCNDKDFEPDPVRGCTACIEADCNAGKHKCVCICRKKVDHNVTISVKSDCELAWVPS